MAKNIAPGWRIWTLMILVLAGYIFSALSIPGGVTITANESLNYSIQSPTSLVTAGGSFTTLNLNVTTQTARWKAYVGNVTGTLTLASSDDDSIYDWTPGTISGEVYAVRTDSPDWTNILCAPMADILTEGDNLNINNSRADSINATFNTTNHKSMYVGTENVSANQCQAVATFVNNTKQSESDGALFQELLLSDGSNMIYTTILEDKKYGFNQLVYDFQMILPNDEFAENPTEYWFYAELG